MESVAQDPEKRNSFCAAFCPDCPPDYRDYVHYIPPGETCSAAIGATAGGRHLRICDEHLYQRKNTPLFIRNLDL